MNNVTGFSFSVAGVPTGRVRVEFPEAATNTSGDPWPYTLTTNGPVTLNTGTGNGDLSPAFTPRRGRPSPRGIQAFRIAP